MPAWSDFVGTTAGYLRLALTGVRLKNNSGNLDVRNGADNAYAETTTSKVNITGNDLVLNSDAAGSGADWTMTISRPSSGMTAAVAFTLPVDDGTSGQVLSTDGSGTLSWASAGTTEQCVTVNSTTLAFDDTSPKTMFTLPANAVVHKVKVIVDTQFNGTAPTLSIGISGTVSKYMATSNVDLTAAAETSFETNPNKAPSGGTEAIIGTYSADSSSAGSARLEVYYSIPA